MKFSSPRVASPVEARGSIPIFLWGEKNVLSKLINEFRGSVVAMKFLGTNPEIDPVS